MRTNTHISDPHDAGRVLALASDGRMWLDERYGHRLRAAGMVGFDAVMDGRRGRRFRKRRVRENWYLPPPEPPQAAGMFLKKHRLRTLVSRVRAWLGLGPGRSPGRAEAENAAGLRCAGIRVMPVVAYGERLGADGWLESFLLTEELRGFEELDRFIRRRFGAHANQLAPPRPSDARANACDRDLRRLLAEMARIARQFHAAGYNHRDFYCCHFFVREPRRGEFDIRMIDLQRIQRWPWFRRRWLVKDLSQLSWSAPAECIQTAHRMAFIKAYLGVRKLRPADKRLIREVLDKHHVMQRRLGFSRGSENP